MDASTLRGDARLVFDDNERGPTDDFALIFEAINTLDDHHKDLARELLEAITIRATAHRWTNAS